MNGIRRLLAALAVMTGFLAGGGAQAGPIPYPTPGVENPVLYTFTAAADGDITAYFGDRTILEDRLRRIPSGTELLLADNYLTIEPYALAMPRDPDFRLEVDRALSRLFRSGGGKKVFAKAFGKDAKPTGLQSSLFVISGLPE